MNKKDTGKNSRKSEKQTTSNKIEFKSDAKKVVGRGEHDICLKDKKMTVGSFCDRQILEMTLGRCYYVVFKSLYGYLNCDATPENGWRLIQFYLQNAEFPNAQIIADIAKCGIDS